MKKLSKSFLELMKIIETTAKLSHIKYALIGGNALDIFINPPTTKDIDIVFSGTIKNKEIFIENLKDKDFVFKKLSSDNEGRITYIAKYKIYELDFLYNFGNIYENAIKNSIYIANIFKVASPVYLFVLKVYAFLKRSEDKDAIGVLLLWNYMIIQEREVANYLLKKYYLEEEFKYIQESRIMYELEGKI